MSKISYFFMIYMFFRTHRIDSDFWRIISTDVTKVSSKIQLYRHFVIWNVYFGRTIRCGRVWLDAEDKGVLWCCLCPLVYCERLSCLIRTTIATDRRPRTSGTLYCIRAFRRCLASVTCCGGCAGAAGRIFALSAHQSTWRSNARTPNARWQVGHLWSSAIGWKQY